MTAVSIDLEAERAQSRRRRDRVMLEPRARMLLEGHWHLDADGIVAAVAERYPLLEEAAAVELVAAAIDLQKQEAPRRIPLESIELPKPEAVTDPPEITPVAELEPQEVQQDEPKIRREAPPPAPIEEPRQEEVMPRSNAVAQVIDDRDWREDAQEALEEVEAGEATDVTDATLFRSLDYLRLEQEPDGAWTLSASMTFTDVARARRVLARLVA